LTAWAFEKVALPDSEVSKENYDLIATLFHYTAFINAASMQRFQKAKQYQRASEAYLYG
jgi:hypothetical protein